jgi:N-carbamoyl-L-amino-acid hydrolase
MQNDLRKIPVQSVRMMADLDKMRSFGASGNGVVRQAFSDVDVQSRKWLADRMADAGLEVHVDAVGNVFGLPPGDGPCLLLGSHSDTQPEGGWLDGVYGVIVALEIARASIEAGGPRIACVSFQDEEGRFTTLTGSRIWTGDLSLAEADELKDYTGQTFAQARAKRGDLPEISEVSPSLFSGFVEMHIEQGPVLDQAGEKIGVVENIVGIRGEKITFIGEQNHAGTTPMANRKDAFQALVKFTAALNAAFEGIVSEASVWTIGHVTLHPNATSIVPGKAECFVQWRDPSDELLDLMRTVVESTAQNVATATGLELIMSDRTQILATQSDLGFVEALSEAAEIYAPGKWRKMASGALHDAANVSKLMPMAMIFVPSINGISHDFAEDTDRADLELGLEVLGEAVARIAARL